MDESDNEDTSEEAEELDEDAAAVPINAVNDDVQRVRSPVMLTMMLKRPQKRWKVTLHLWRGR